MGLKLRVLLFAASPLFNDNEPYLAGDASDAKMTWYGNYDVNRWKEPKLLARRLWKNWKETVNMIWYSLLRKR